MERTCSSCYMQLEKASVCNGCKSHPYCSRLCQVSDWKSHKKWCSFPKHIGELDIDFEIKATSDGKGLGIFSLRDFSPGEKILLEKPVLVLKGVANTSQSIDDTERQFAALSEPIQQAIMMLHPLSSDSFIDKFNRNCLGTGDKEDDLTLVCVTSSRFNHSCLPNCDRFYITEQNLLVFSAIVPISVGDEISICYTELRGKESYVDYQARLQTTWQFSCTCRACKESDIGHKLVLIKQLDDALFEFGMSMKFEEAYATGEELLRLYQVLKYSHVSYKRTYYDMFQMSVVKKRTLARAKSCLEKALEYGLMVSGGSTPETEDNKKYREYRDRPETHKYYLVAK